MNKGRTFSSYATASLSLVVCLRVKGVSERAVHVCVSTCVYCHCRLLPLSALLALFLSHSVHPHAHTHTHTHTHTSLCVCNAVRARVRECVATAVAAAVDRQLFHLRLASHHVLAPVFRHISVSLSHSALPANLLSLLGSSLTLSTK